MRAQSTYTLVINSHTPHISRGILDEIIVAHYVCCCYMRSAARLRTEYYGQLHIICVIVRSRVITIAPHYIYRHILHNIMERRHNDASTTSSFSRQSRALNHPHRPTVGQMIAGFRAKAPRRDEPTTRAILIDLCQLLCVVCTLLSVRVTSSPGLFAQKCAL